MITGTTETFPSGGISVGMDQIDVETHAHTLFGDIALQLLQCE